MKILKEQAVNRTKRLIAFASFLLVVFSFVFAKPSPMVFAELVSGDGGSTSGSGSGSGCVYDYDTCHGATWRWYAWPAGASSVTVNGAGKDYTQGFTISGHDAEVCARAGGYYRYGLVSKSSGNQVGSLPISGNSSAVWNSGMLDGTLHYRGPSEGGEDWGSVAAAYNSAAVSNGYTKPGLVPGSRLMWFCAAYEGGGDNPGGGGGPGPTPVPTPSASCDSWTPASYVSNQTSVITKVRNSSTSGGYSDMAWVGVGQTAQWIHCYYPGVQRMAGQSVTYNNRKPDTWTCDTAVPTKYLDYVSGGSFHNVSSNNGPFSSATTWQNYFNINRSSANGSFSGTSTGGSYGTGVSNVQAVTDSHGVNSGNIGDTLRENATTGIPTSAGRNVYPADSLTWSCGYYLKTGEVDKPDGCGQTRYNCRRWLSQDGSCSYGYAPNGASCSCTYGGKSRSGTVTGGVCYWKDGYYSYKTDVTSCPSGWTVTQARYTGDCHKENVYSSRTASIHNANDFISWSVNNNPASSNNAEVKVPYNYTITGTIDLGEGVVYAGESVGVGSGKITNGSKWNGVTGNSYATYARDVKYKLISYVSDRDESEETLNISAGGNICSAIGHTPCDESSAQSIGYLSAYGSQTISGAFTSANVPDIDAGQYFCVALATYPVNSGSDTNMGNWNGNGRWGVSGTSCRIVAKKPNMQVWGGGLYSAGAISTLEAYKNNLAGVAGKEYKQTGTANTTVFGSWVEQAVYSVGLVQGLASGAATSGGSFEGGSYGTGYCNFRTPLSFANYSASAASQICNSAQRTGGMATAAGVTDRKILLNKLINDNNEKIIAETETIDINAAGMYVNAKTINDKDVRYTYKTGSYNIGNTTIGTGITHVVRSDADIRIVGNIEYQNEAYNNMEQVPKLVIYANNIIIDCAVNRVDAILLAENDINTCDNEDKNDEKNSNQLRINGTVITDTLTLNRSYGGATGINSGTPAEIINYDTSLILWASLEMDVSDTDNMNITYQSELAPRL